MLIEQKSVPARVSGLDLLRAAAILCVMRFHTSGLQLPLAGVARYGWMGVDLFFALSGYLIASQLFKTYLAGRTSLYPRAPLRHFYIRRACRILPAYLVVLTLYFAVPVFREEPGIASLWSFLSFTENFVIDYANSQAFSHAWSLCVEEHFYLLLPVILALLLRWRSARIALSAGAGVLLGGMLLRWLLWRHLSHIDDPDDYIVAYIERIYYPTYTRLDGLLVGVCLAATKWLRPARWAVAVRHADAFLGGGTARGRRFHMALLRPIFTPRDGLRFPVDVSRVRCPDRSCRHRKINSLPPQHSRRAMDRGTRLQSLPHP